LKARAFRKKRAYSSRRRIDAGRKGGASYEFCHGVLQKFFRFTACASCRAAAPE
jgi:hypothetical protein